MLSAKNIEVAKRLGYTVYHYDKDVAERCYYRLMDAEGDPVIDGWAEGDRKTETEAWADVPKWDQDHRLSLELWKGRDGFRLSVDGDRFGAVFAPDGNRVGGTDWVDIDRLPEALVDLWLSVVDIEAIRRAEKVAKLREKIKELEQQITDIESAPHAIRIVED